MERGEAGGGHNPYFTQVYLSINLIFELSFELTQIRNTWEQNTNYMKKKRKKKIPRAIYDGYFSSPPISKSFKKINKKKGNGGRGGNELKLLQKKKKTLKTVIFIKLAFFFGPMPVFFFFFFFPDLSPFPIMGSRGFICPNTAKLATHSCRQSWMAIKNFKKRKHQIHFLSLGYIYKI